MRCVIAAGLCLGGSARDPPGHGLTLSLGQLNRIVALKELGLARAFWPRIRTCSSLMRVALNIADLFEHAVDAAPGRPALRFGDRVLTYADLDADANRLAHFLSSQGVQPGEHVALYARNSIEHVIGLLAILKIRAVSINVNYRYVEGELDYLFDNADVVALIHERCYAPLVARCAPRHPKLGTFVVLPDVMDPDNDADVSEFGGVLFEDALAGQGAGRDFGLRSADDLHIIYTGGTTGFPKGVMWRQEDFWRVLGGGIDFYTGQPLSEYDQSEQARQDGRLVTFPLSPLMHGGAQTGLFLHLFAGHVTILEPRFDPARTWEIVERQGVQLLFMTGDAMARPLIEEFERQAATGRPYVAASLVAVSSTAAIFSPEVKARWLAAFPNAVITDSVGATETGFQGMGLQDKASIRHDGTLVALGPGSVVIGDDGRVLDLESNIGVVGRLGRTGNVPVGYYNDAEKSAATFLVIDGVRYSVPGDSVRIEADHKVTLLGRGSNCVNTGGEKVYPEEVEAAIKAHPAVYDCLVVGVPDDKYGQAVAAVVELRAGQSVELEALRTFLRASLSGYKLPRTMTLVGKVPRNPAGKAQYPQARELALAKGGVRQSV
jgi:3-oxocholest-4-en-26-oate---CoA ligase